MPEQSRSDAIQLVADGLAQAERMIRLQRPRAVAIYEAGLQAFSQLGGPTAESEELRQMGLTFAQFNLLLRYMFAMAFIAAWYDVFEDNVRNDETVQAAVILVMGAGIDSEGAFSTIGMYEQLWKGTLTEEGMEPPADNSRYSFFSRLAWIPLLHAPWAYSLPRVGATAVVGALIAFISSVGEVLQGAFVGWILGCWWVAFTFKPGSEPER